jgi:anti-repressor protein
MYATDELLDNPDLLIQVATRLKDEKERNKQLQLESAQKDITIKELEPKADSYEKFISSKGFQPMNEVAKVLGWGRNKLFARLRCEGILMSDNVPYQRYCDSKYFVVKESVVERGFNTFVNTQTFVTPKGIEYIKRLLSNENCD